MRATLTAAAVRTTLTAALLLAAVLTALLDAPGAILNRKGT